MRLRYWFCGKPVKNDPPDLKIILIHGNGGATSSLHWFPFVKIALEKLDLRVIAPDFPDPKLARAAIWLSYLRNNLQADDRTILIGHSSGGLAAMRYAETNTIFGSVLVGVNHTDLGDSSEKQSGYYDSPWNWSQIKANQNWIIQFASTDDPYIPVSEPRFIHDRLKSDYYEYSDRGHFMFPNFPELLQILQEKLK